MDCPPSLKNLYMCDAMSLFGAQIWRTSSVAHVPLSGGRSSSVAGHVAANDGALGLRDRYLVADGAGEHDQDAVG